MSPRFWEFPVLRLIATDRCRVEAPWFTWSGARDRTAELRRLAVSLERARLGRVTRIEQAIAAVVYLPLSLLSIVVAVRKHGRALAKEYGISQARQMIQLVGYAWRLGVPPREYYQLRLHRHHWTGTGRH